MCVVQEIKFLFQLAMLHQEKERSHKVKVAAAPANNRLPPLSRNEAKLRRRTGRWIDGRVKFTFHERAERYRRGPSPRWRPGDR